MDKKKLSVPMVVACLVLSTLMLSVLAAKGPVPGTIDESAIPAKSVEVGLKLFKTYEGVGYVASGIGVRNTGRGTINIMVPKGASLRDAWLYWMVLDNKPNPKPDSDKIDICGVRVVGNMIGSGPDPCWPPNSGFTYRANVKYVLKKTGVFKGGAFGVPIGGMNSYRWDGRSPFDQPDPGTRVPLAEYVGLVLIFGHKTVPGGAIVQIFDGYWEGSGAQTFVYNWPPRAAGGARFSHLTADGQRVGITQPSTKSVDIGGTFIDKHNTLPGDDPSIMTKSTYQGSLADTDTYSVGRLAPAVGGPTTITWQCKSDCISWAALVFWTSTDAPP